MSSEKSAFIGPKYKIILVGDCHVGKTSIFWRYIQNESVAEHPLTTIDFRYKSIQLHDKEVKLCIWDTAGQEKFRSIVATYFKSCQGVVLVFDMSEPESWENIKHVWY
jgi:small GTP-binding protein